MQWYYAVKNQQQGPVEWNELLGLVQAGKVLPSDLVWNADMGSQWVKASTVEGLFPAGGGSPESPTVVSGQPGQTPNREIMAQARDALAGHWGTAVGGGVVYFLVVLGLALVQGTIPFFGYLVQMALQGAVVLGACGFYLKMSRKEEVSIGALFDGFQNFWTAFVAYLLMMLLIFAWALPGVVIVIVAFAWGAVGTVKGSGSGAFMLWLIPVLFLAMIPAMIAQLRYSQTYYVLCDQPGLGGLEAIRVSTRLMQGNKWKLLCLHLRFLGWTLLALLTLGIGFLWLFPYMMASQAHFHDDIKRGQE